MANLARSAYGLQSGAPLREEPVLSVVDVHGGGSHGRAELVKTLEQQVIPRLVMAHCGDMYEAQSCRDARVLPTGTEIEALADAAVRSDTRQVAELVEAMLRQGLTLESTLLDYVGPAAALLGAQWADDLRSWTDVTLGTGTLQRVVQVLSPNATAPVINRGLVVLMAAPGEQHTVGLHILGELMRREGWGVHVQPSLSEHELLGLVESELVNAVGISTTDAERLGGLSEFVSQIRKRSLNPDVEIMLGGSANGLSRLANKHGIFYAVDAREALHALERPASSRPRAIAG